MNATLIAIGLGLISAIAFLSATTGPLPARLMFSLLTPLPIFLAGLGWGVRAGLFAAMAGGGILLAVSPAAGGFFLTSAALPAALLSYLALLSRPIVANGEPETEASPREWYPAGRLVVWTAGLAAIPAIIWSVVLESNGPEIKEQLSKMLEEAIKAANIKQSATGLPLAAEDIALLTKYIYAAMPAATAIAWMAGLLLTMWLSGRIMKSSGQLTRPWPDLGKIDFPSGTALAFLAALFLSPLEGVMGLAGRAVLGSLFLAFLLLGLAVLHDLTKGWQWRSFVLGTIYGGLLVVSLAVALPLAALGLSEGLFNFRGRFSPKSGTT